MLTGTWKATEMVLVRALVGHWYIWGPQELMMRKKVEVFKVEMVALMRCSQHGHDHIFTFAARSRSSYKDVYQKLNLHSQPQR
jgi:hypothetical protein